MLFRRLLGCTMIVFGAVIAFEVLGRHLDPGPRFLAGVAVAIPALAVAGLAAVTATRLARALNLSPAVAFGLGAVLPCPNLIVLARFGSHMVSGWAAAGMSPLVLLQPRSTLEDGAPSRASVPPSSALGFIATLVLVLAYVGGIGKVIELIDGKLQPGAQATLSSPAAPPRPTPDSGFYRPFAVRGQAAFQEADSRLSRLDAPAVAFGNSPAGEKVAERIGEVMEREVREAIAAYPAFKPVADAGGLRVYVHVRPERAAVLMQIPRFDTVDETTRAALLHFGWRAATRELRSLRLVGARRVALALRDAGPYSAVTWGDLTDQQPRQNDTRTPADTAPIAAFFMDSRLPAPVVEPLPGTVGARLLEQRRSGPLQATAEWKAYAGATSGDSASRQRLEAIHRYLTTEDVEDLLQALGTDAMPATETRAALSLLTELALGYDARISLEQEGRLVAALRARCLEASATRDAVCSYALRREWGGLDRPFLESTFERRLEDTGQRDRDLWQLLIETRERADPARWPSILAKVARAEVGRGRGAGDVMPYWLEADPAAAEHYVLELSPRTLKAEVRVWLTYALLSVALARDQTAAAGGRLAEIVALGGPAATRARVAREIIGLDRQDRIEALALKWRETRTIKSLGELFHAYIEDLPMGTPFGRWCERLGETGPEATRRPTSFHVTPRDSSSTLFVELDKEGRLRAISFD